MSIFSAKVKSVISGDTLVLTPLNNAKSERQLSLAYVTAPRLLSNEQYGYESREFLRLLLVNKQIQFKVLYNVNDREYGDVMAPVFPSLIEKALEEGSVKLRDDARGKQHYEDDYQEKLEKAQEKAKNASKGLWSPSMPKPVEVLSLVPDQVKFGDDSTEYSAIVERVVSGDRLQLRVILDPKKAKHYVGPALLAGVRTPRSAGPDLPAEPFGEEAKEFVSSKLLQRNVKAQFLEKSSAGVPVVRIVHPAGDIAEFVLRAGLGSVADWHSQCLGVQSMNKLRAAESLAKSHKQKIWQNAVASDGQSKSYDATIARVVSSDTYSLILNNDEERTVQLASIRAPRKNDATQELYAAPAKEFARSKWIGKKVHVEVIAIRPKSDQFEERELVTILHQNKNIALIVIENGFGNVVRHRQDDNDRSPQWDELVQKEKEAISAGKGMHSKKKPAASKNVDASETLTKAKGYLTSLQRQPKITGVVDYISSGGRFRIIVPRENCILTLVLGGVRVPRQQEAFGEEALSYVSRRFWQRDVSFSISGTDKTGGFIGQIYFPSNSSPLSVALVKEGLAEVHEFSAQNSGFGDELFEAEQEAKTKRRGIWKDYVEKAPIVEEPVSTETKTAVSRNYIDAIITNISPKGELSYRSQQDDNEFQKLSAELASFNQAAANASLITFKGAPRRNELLTYVTGKKYYRARIIEHEKEAYQLLLIDVGSVVTATASSLRQLPAQYQQKPALSAPAELSFIEIPPMTEHVEEYVTYFQNKGIIGQKLVANVDNSGPPASLTLYTVDSSDSEDTINSSLIYNGYAFVRQKLPLWAKNSAFSKTISHLKELQDDCKREHIGIWEYGDPREDE